MQKLVIVTGMSGAGKTIALKILEDLDDDSTTSMQRDVQNGGPSEMDGLVHRIVRLADEYGLELPAYRKISRWAVEQGLL